MLWKLSYRLNVLMLLTLLLSHTPVFAMPIHFSVLPLAWDIHTTGTVQASFKRVHVDRTQLSPMLYFQIENQYLGIFINAMYLNLSQSRQYALYNVNASNKFSVVSAALYGIFYRKQYRCGYNSCESTLEPYLGVRVTNQDSTVTVRNSFLNLRLTHHEDWSDPIIGLRFITNLGEHWGILASGDVGGQNRNTQYSYDLLGLVSYNVTQLTNHLSLYGGYQLLDQHYSHGQNANYYNWDVKISGPIVGLGIAF